MLARPRGGGRGSRAPVFLAGLVLVLLMAALALMSTGPGPGARAGDVPNLEAMKNAQTPGWIAALNPFIGVAGVLAGSALVARRGGRAGAGA